MRYNILQVGIIMGGYHVPFETGKLDSIGETVDTEIPCFTVQSENQPELVYS
jgi:hypothetical protein